MSRRNESRPGLVGRPRERQQDAREAVVIRSAMLIRRGDDMAANLTQERNVFLLHDRHHIALTVRHPGSHVEEWTPISGEERMEDPEKVGATGYRAPDTSLEERWS